MDVRKDNSRRRLSRHVRFKLFQGSIEIGSDVGKSSFATAKLWFFHTRLYWAQLSDSLAMFSDIKPVPLLNFLQDFGQMGLGF